MTQNPNTFQNLTDAQIEEIIVKVEASKPWSGWVRSVEMFLLKWYSRVIFTYIGINLSLYLNQIYHSFFEKNDIQVQFLTTNLSFSFGVIIPFVLLDIYFLLYPPIVENLTSKEFAKKFLKKEFETIKISLPKIFISVAIIYIILYFLISNKNIIYIFLMLSSCYYIFYYKINNQISSYCLYKDFIGMIHSIYTGIIIFVLCPFVLAMVHICLPFYGFFLNDVEHYIQNTDDNFLKYTYVSFVLVWVYQVPTMYAELYNSLRARLIIQTIENYLNKRKLDYDR